MKLGLDDIKFYFINLSTRQDRLHNIMQELSKIDVTAERFEACTHNSPSHGFNLLRHNNGQKGCSLSHITLMMNFDKSQGKHLGIFEDDAFFCEDFQSRWKYIEENFNRDWDIFFMDSFYHLNDYPRKHHDIEYELTDIKYIHRVYSHFCTHSYVINVNSIDKILQLYRENISKTWAIDALQIIVEPMLNCYAFTPGMAGQISNKSDIQGKFFDQMAYFYKECGRHIFAQNLSEFDYQSYFNK